MDSKMYKKYKRSIANAVAKVDNAPPKFDVSVYFKPRNLEADAIRVKEIDEENMEMLKNMNIIYRLGGNIDCWREKVVYKSNLENQEPQNRMIMKANKKLLKKIQKAASQYSAADFLKSWRQMRLKALQDKKFPSKNGDQFPSETKDYCMVKNIELLKNMNPIIRTRCFFEIKIREADQKLGKIIFELYDDIVPRTSANFAALCRGTNGLSYKNTPFHRILSAYWCQGGDNTKYNGTGGNSIYGESFERENFDLRHGAPGVLSMCNNEYNKNDSKFNLTFKKLKTVNGKNVVFGKVIKGLMNIYKIEEFGTKTGKPVKTVIVSDCGVLPFKRSKTSKKIDKLKSANITDTSMS
ncbi:hypothetical protein KM043_014677 [Ampulex compressa]|nr:hypothetical protein KM043_014677 [Ampulex compressa]